MANPFASYAAGSNNGGNNDGGWLTTRKVGRDREEIKKAANVARENRTRKNGRGNKANCNTDKKASKGGSQKSGNKKKGKSRDGWMAESSEEEDFIIEQTETEDEGEWNGEESSEEELVHSEGEDEDSDEDYQHKKRSNNKKVKAAAVRSDIRNRRNAAQNKNAKNSIINVDDDTTDDEGKGVDTSMDDIFDEDAKELVVRSNKEKKGKEKKTSPYFSSGFDEKKDDDDDVGSKSDESEMMVDNDVSRSKVTSKRRRMILSDGDDESSGDDMPGRKQSSMKLGKRPKDSCLGDDDEYVLADTPAKAKGQFQSFSGDDFVDDDEAKAIEKAMKNSIKDEKKRKRLKKMGGRGDSLASLDRKDEEKKKKTIYKEDFEDDESIVDVEGEEGQDEDEDDVFEVVNEEEQTASEVLKEANALSAKIVKVVSGWCGGDVGKVQGLILGDGALNLGVGSGGDGGGAKDGGDKTWISKETMKQVLPNVDLAEYQLLGLNWMALLNRTTFGSRGSKKSSDGRDLGVAVNGILADEVRSFFFFACLVLSSLAKPFCHFPSRWVWARLYKQSRFLHG